MKSPHLSHFVKMSQSVCFSTKYLFLPNIDDFTCNKRQICCSVFVIYKILLQNCSDLLLLTWD